MKEMLIDRATRAVLRQLSGGRQLHAMELLKWSGGDLIRGSLFPHLSRMEDAGLISSAPDGVITVDGASVPGRRLYQATEHGLRRMAEGASPALPAVGT